MADCRRRDGRRACGRSSGRYCMAGQYSYVPLRRHLIKITNSLAVCITETFHSVQNTQMNRYLTIQTMETLRVWVCNKQFKRHFHVFTWLCNSVSHIKGYDSKWKFFFSNHSARLTFCQPRFLAALVDKLQMFNVRFYKVSSFSSGRLCWFNASMQFCFTTALSMRWQRLAKLKTFYNQCVFLLSIRITSGSHTTVYQ